MSNDRSTFREILLEGIVKFAGEIVGGLLLALLLLCFPGLHSLLTDYTFPKTNKSQSEIQKESEAHSMGKARLATEGLIHNAAPATSDEDFLKLCEAGNVVEVKEAIKNGANVNAKNNYGSTALMHATVIGYTETTELLLKHGADVNAKNVIGWTALMGAAVIGDIELVALLIKYGVDVNAQDHNGCTALMQATASGPTETVELLLKHGADVNARDKDGETALMWATKYGHTQRANLLRKYGAK